MHRWGKEAEQAVSSIAAVSRDPSESLDVRVQAIHTLGAIGAPASQVIPALIGLVTSGHFLERVFALRVLGGMGSLAEDALPVIYTALTDADPDVSQNAAYALGCLRAGDPATVGALAKAVVALHAQ